MSHSLPGQFTGCTQSGTGTGFCHPA